MLFTVPDAGINFHLSQFIHNHHICLNIHNLRKKGFPTIALIAGVVVVVLAVFLVLFSHNQAGSSGSYSPFGAFGGTPQVTQVGTGVLYSNGTAIFTLKSTGRVSIVDAFIVGTLIRANITTIPLTSGYNNVIIQFNSSQLNELQPGAAYAIALGLSDGETVDIAVIYQQLGFPGTPVVTQVGTGTIYYNNGEYIAVIDLHSTGTVTIVNAELAGIQPSPTPVSSTIYAGYNTVTISIPASDISGSLQPGATYTISLGLSDYETVNVAVIYEPQ